MTFRERLARWLAPEPHEAPPLREVALKRLAEPIPAPSPAPEAPARMVADVAPEYEAMIALNWGQMPVAATLTRARVKLLQTAKAPPTEIRRAIFGTEIPIE